MIHLDEAARKAREMMDRYDIVDPAYQQAKEGLAAALAEHDAAAKPPEAPPDGFYAVHSSGQEDPLWIMVKTDPTCGPCVWGFSIYEGKPGYRTLGISWSEFVSRTPRIEPDIDRVAAHQDLADAAAKPVGEEIAKLCKAGDHWAAEMDKAASAVEEQSDGSVECLQIIDGNRAIARVLRDLTEQVRRAAAQDGLRKLREWIVADMVDPDGMTQSDVLAAIDRVMAGGEP